MSVKAKKEKTKPERIVRIGHYQCECAQGDFEANLKKVIHGLELAKEANLDIVSFPESFLTGYYFDPKQCRKHSILLNSAPIKKTLKATSRFNITVIVGFNEIRNGDLYNTAIVTEKGKLLGTYSKSFPCFGHHVPGREFPIFEKKGLKFGVVICADGGYIEPCRILALKGAKVIFAPHFNFISNSVMHYQQVRHDHMARARENGIYFLKANNVVPASMSKPVKIKGAEHVGCGYGDSYIIDPNGQIVAGAGLYDETLMTYSLDIDRYFEWNNVRNSLRSANALLDILKENLRPSE